MLYLSSLWILSLRCKDFAARIHSSSSLSWFLKVFPWCFRQLPTYIFGLWAFLQLLILAQKRKCQSVSFNFVSQYRLCLFLPCQFEELQGMQHPAPLWSGDRLLSSLLDRSCCFRGQMPVLAPPLSSEVSQPTRKGRLDLQSNHSQHKNLTEKLNFIGACTCQLPCTVNWRNFILV